MNSNAGVNSVSLSNGDEILVKLSSQEARSKAESELDIEDCSNCEVNLVEAKVKGKSRAVYEVKARKQAKIFGIFRTSINVFANIDVETGEVVSVGKPWWAFLASESRATVASDNADEKAIANANSNSNLDRDWCNEDYAKEIYVQANAQKDNYKIVEAKGLGFVDYEGKRACHVYVKTEFSAEGQHGTSETDVYSYTYSKEKNDFDATIISKTNIYGQNYDYTYRWENGVCVSGNGCDLAK